VDPGRDDDEGTDSKVTEVVHSDGKDGSDTSPPCLDTAPSVPAIAEATPASLTPESASIDTASAQKTPKSKFSRLFGRG
jgi:hypothetical protein